MIIDTRKLSEDTVLETDICIVGGGPAGITLALEFIDQKFEVCLVESGGFDFDNDTQALSEGEVIGDPYPPLTSHRCRRFGGTSHYWGAQIGYKVDGFRCLPLDEIDFEQRDWVPHSGWPFNKSHLDPYYERAHKVCQIGAYTYEVKDWQAQNAQPLAFEGNRLLTSMCQYGSRTPFTYEYQERIRQSQNVKVLIYANVVDITTDDLVHVVEQVRLSCLSGRQISLKAKAFILATGGIENPRLLLRANRQMQAGLGNQNDLVGRFFMERPIVSCGMLTPLNRRLFDITGLYDIREFNGIPVMAWVAMQRDYMRSEHLLNNGAQLFPRPLPRQKQATQSAKELLGALKQLNLSNIELEDILNSVRGLDYLIAAGFWAFVRRIPGLKRGDWSYLPYEKRRFSSFEVIYQIEQAPSPSNRVVLGETRDSLGLPQVQVYWRLNDIDIQNIKRVQKIWEEEFAISDIGKLQLANAGESLVFHKPAMAHHMGTTRMHINPKEGVVDADCRVHGIANLFIAGSSVFPTAGYANPTLTIIALAIRLADRVKAFMQSSTHSVNHEGIAPTSIT
jgi:choline dehydrogenase-like flavoprotein